MSRIFLSKRRVNSSPPPVLIKLTWFAATAHSVTHLMHRMTGLSLPSGLPDIPAAWPEQLAPGGKIVVPLHLGVEPHQCVLVNLEPKDGCLTGVGLGSLDMVLFRSDTARYSKEITRRRGKTWQGAKTDELKITVYPADADVPLEPQQLQIKKPSSLTVLERVH